jgi:hypothetical protein
MPSGKKYFGVRYPTGSICLPHRVVTMVTAEGFRYELAKIEVKKPKTKRRIKYVPSFDWGRDADEKNVRFLAASLLVDIKGTKRIGKKLLHNFECMMVRTFPELEWSFDGDSILEIMESQRTLMAIGRIQG